MVNITHTPMTRMLEMAARREESVFRDVMLCGSGVQGKVWFFKEKMIKLNHNIPNNASKLIC